MVRRSDNPEFIEALARGLDTIRVFQPGESSLSLSTVATRTELARPTARRILLTLAELGYVRIDQGMYFLTPKVLELGMAYSLSLGLWEVAAPHMQKLVAFTHESSSIAQLDGSDIVYVYRVAVSKIVGLRVTIGTRFPAIVTSLGKVLLAALSAEELDLVLSIPSRSGIDPKWRPGKEEILRELTSVRAQGWALTDEELALGIRSVAAPLRDGTGRVIAALNVNAHSAETSIETLTEAYLPKLLTTAAEISADWALVSSAPQKIISNLQ